MLILSFASYEPRYKFLPQVVESIYNQTIKPDKIILWVPDKIDYTFTDIDIRVCEDLHSYNKLIYTRQEYPNNTIITIDDDCMYQPDMIERLLEQSTKHPNCIIAHRCHTIDWFNVRPYRLWQNTNGINIPSFQNFFTGVGGVLYPPNSFYRDWNNIKLIKKLAPLADDIWFNFMAYLNKTKIVTTKYNSYTTIPHSQHIRLSRINTEQNYNDAQFKWVLDYYKDVLNKRHKIYGKNN